MKITKEEQRHAERLAGQHCQELIDLSTKTNHANILAIINAVYSMLENSFCAGWVAKHKYDSNKAETK